MYVKCTDLETRLFFNGGINGILFGPPSWRRQTAHCIRTLFSTEHPCGIQYLCQTNSNVWATPVCKAFYTPGIYAEGYIVFVFLLVRSSVRMFVRSFVCSFVRTIVELLQSFTLKFLKWGISQQPFIGKHSYLEHRYPGGSVVIP